MRRYITTYLRNFDYLLFFTYVFLCLFGLVMIYSASMMVGIVYEDGTPDYFYRKQLTNLIIGALAFFIGVFFPYKHYSINNAKPFNTQDSAKQLNNAMY